MVVQELPCLKEILQPVKSVRIGKRIPSPINQPTVSLKCSKLCLSIVGDLPFQEDFVDKGITEW